MTSPRVKRLIWLACAYWAFVLLVYVAAGEQFRQMNVVSDALQPVSATGEILDGVQLTQRLKAPSDKLTGLDVVFATFGRVNTGPLQIDIETLDGKKVSRQTVDMSGLKDGQYTAFPFSASVQAVSKDEPLLLRISAPGAKAGNAVAVYYGNTVMAGRFEIMQPIAAEDHFQLNGAAGAGMLSVQLHGVKRLNFYRTYWYIVAGLFVALAAYTAYGYRQGARGKNNAVMMVDTLFGRYRFLLRQLVLRDFKLKYKRSVLGMGWSFLNPLLTMLVQYLVFSTLFKSGTANYPVYLLSGIVFFNFFSEAVSLGMTSITGNAALIKKVYMPKYIYPLSKLFLSLINLVLALIPLMVVTILTGTPIKPSILLLSFVIVCLIGFTLGMALMLSSLMTFFQDTQFLWSILVMLWMYLTPIFYPETIIPARFLTLYHANPMYQFITFARICIIDGVSPEPMAYLWCMLSASVVLVLGLYVFRRNQDRFILYL